MLIFEGVTRNHHDGRTVMRLEWGYAGMAEAQMSAICATRALAGCSSRDGSPSRCGRRG